MWERKKNISKGFNKVYKYNGLSQFGMIWYSTVQKNINECVTVLN